MRERERERESERERERDRETETEREREGEGEGEGEGHGNTTGHGVTESQFVNRETKRGRKELIESCKGIHTCHSDCKEGEKQQSIVSETHGEISRCLYLRRLC